MTIFTGSPRAIGLTPEKQALKRAQLQLVRAAGGVEAAAGFCRLGKSQLANTTSANDPACFMPADVIDDLEAVTAGTPDHPVVTRFLARQRGFELFALPSPAVVGGDWHQLLARFAKEGGEVMAQIAIHAPEGITAREVAACNLVGEIDEAIAILVNMRAAACAAISES